MFSIIHLVTLFYSWVQEMHVRTGRRCVVGKIKKFCISSLGADSLLARRMASDTGICMPASEACICMNHTYLLRFLCRCDCAAAAAVDVSAVRQLVALLQNQ